MQEWELPSIIETNSLNFSLSLYNTSMKIVFFGSGYYTIPIVKELQNKGLCLIVTNENDGELERYAHSENIPFLCTNFKKKSDIEIVKTYSPELGILASYGAFIPKEIIDLFPMGILNIHPSLLPKYKGPSPIQFTILNGDTVSGVSVIQLDDKIDHGPIVAQKEVKISNNATLKTLTELLFQEGSLLIKEIIQYIEKVKKIDSIPQNTKNETWTQKIEKENGKIDFSNPPEKDKLLRKIRAFYPWPGVYLTVSLGKKNKLLKLMPNDMVQVEGKKPMSYNDFINGYGNDAVTILQKLNLQ